MLEREALMIKATLEKIKDDPVHAYHLGQCKNCRVLAYSVDRLLKTREDLLNVLRLLSPEELKTIRKKAEEKNESKC